MTVLDYIVINVIIASIILSLIRGFTKESLSLATWVVAFIVALHYSTALSPYLMEYIGNEKARYGVSFIILLMVVLIVGSFFNHWMSILVQHSPLNGTDRLLGIIFGTVRGLVIVGIAIFLLDMTPLNQAPWWQKSQTLPAVKQMIHKVNPEVAKYFHKPAKGH